MPRRTMHDYYNYAMKFIFGKGGPELILCHHNRTLVNQGNGKALENVKKFFMVCETPFWIM